MDDWSDSQRLRGDSTVSDLVRAGDEFFLFSLFNSSDRGIISISHLRK